MKKNFRILMLAVTIISMLSGLLVMASAVEVPSAYIGASDYLITDGTSSSASQPIFKDGKVTFKINLASGVTVTGALVTVKFDKNVLRVIDADIHFKLKRKVITKQRLLLVCILTVMLSMMILLILLLT